MKEIEKVLQVENFHVVTCDTRNVGMVKEVAGLCGFKVISMEPFASTQDYSYVDLEYTWEPGSFFDASMRLGKLLARAGINF